MKRDTYSDALPEAATEYDLIIIGAGLTGLSLVCWLLQLAESEQKTLPRVCLLEPRTHYSNDRTWCFWDLEAHPFRQLISHRWFCWQVSQQNQIARQTDNSAAYAMLPAEALYKHALAKIANTPAFTLQLGVMVDTVQQDDDGVLVAGSVCGSTKHWQAKAVIDTRPPSDSLLSAGEGCWQVFSGLEVACAKHGFDTSTAILMDFQSGYRHPCFIYLLPLDQDHFLVEWTAFQADKKTPADYSADVKAWLQRQNIGPYHVTRVESGSLPMMRLPNNVNSGRVLNAGISAGWMRAATGYHFVSCQRGCAALARQILTANDSENWQLQSPQVRTPWLDWMDKVFLRALKRHPEQAPQWFVGLFAATSAAQMSRFMNDQPFLGDAWAVANALPPAPFIRGLLPW
jgi:lycopene beta-cyclase